MITRLAAVLVIGAAALTIGGSTAEASDPTRGLPHCLAEDGGPQPVCVWDSAVDGNGLPAAPNNVVIVYTSRPGQDPIAHRIK